MGFSPPSAPLVGKEASLPQSFRHLWTPLLLGVAGDWDMRTPRRQKHRKGKGPGLGPLPLRIRQPLPSTPAPGFWSSAETSFWVLGCMQSRLGSWIREEAEPPSLWWGFKFWSSSLLGLLLFALQSPQIAALSILPRFYTLFMYMYVL